MAEIEITSENDGHVDWKGRKLDPIKHGGNRAAAFVYVVEVLENMVFLCNATNFITYFLTSMHYPAAHSANMVTNFMATSFLLTILGGFISDSFLTRFRVFILSCTTELIGMIILFIQSQIPHLQPPAGQTPSRSQAALLYIGLYAVAVGVGGIKASLQAHGADQFHHTNQRLVSAFFNWFFFSLCTGGLLASTLMVWVQENKGWNLSFKISIIALCVALCIFTSGFPLYRYKLPSGSPFSRMFKVLASAIRNRKVSSPRFAQQNPALGETSCEVDRSSRYKFKFLDKALVDGKTSTAEVQETRTFLGLLPIFASTIMMNCCLAQLQTFSVQQGHIMDRKIHNFNIPPQSLSVIPIIFMLVSIMIYEHFGNRFLGKSNIFQPLKRIGLGLALASASMAVAAIIEVKRRSAAENEVIISVFWLAWQYLLLGVSDMLTLGGMLEFFYSEAPESMRSMCTALSWCSTSMGYFLSSVIVEITNSASGRYGKPWLGTDLNRSRLDLFYTILCILDFLNLLNYIYWAKRY